MKKNIFIVLALVLCVAVTLVACQQREKTAPGEKVVVDNEPAPSVNPDIVLKTGTEKSDYELPRVAI